MEIEVAIGLTSTDRATTGIQTTSIQDPYV